MKFVYAFSNEKQSRIVNLTQEEILAFDVPAITSMHPVLQSKRGWSLVDGLNLYLEEPPDYYIQLRL